MATENMNGLSEDVALSLVNLLSERGYFGGSDHVDEYDCEDDSEETMKEQQLSEDTSGFEDLFVYKPGGVYVSRDQLKIELDNLLIEHGGRLSREEACALLGVDSSALPQQDHDVFITEQYYDRISLHVSNRINANGGFLPISDLATNVLHLPFETVQRELAKRTEQIGARIATAGGVSALITPQYEIVLQAKIHGALQAAVTPILIDSLCHDMGWDNDLCLTLIQKERLQGEIRDGAGGALFVPAFYTHMQRKGVEEFFQSQGYITSSKCQNMGVSNMGDFINSLFPAATMLENSMIIEERLVAPLVAVLQDAISENKFVDLRMHLPEDLLELENDRLALIKLSGVDDGEIVQADSEILFVSNGMVKNFTTKTLPPLIEKFAEQRALELEALESLENDDNEEECEVIGGKHKRSLREKRRQKKTSKGKNTLTRQHGIVPLVTVGDAIKQQFPELAEIHEVVSPFYSDPNASNTPKWETAEGDDLCGPLYDFCRKVFYTKQLQIACHQAVSAELERIQSTKKAASIRGQTSAAKSRSVAQSFEDPSCFAAACFQLQVHAKFVDFCAASPVIDESWLEVIKNDFLSGCCANFAGRITQYCLFKSELDGDIFSFSDVEKDEQAEHAPHPFAEPVDRAARHFPKTALSCLDENDGTKTEPLQTLRKVLSGSLGASLAQLWSHCGSISCDECQPVGYNEETSPHQGDIEQFLSCAEENCFIICGIPFKRLDKKSEKQFLLARKQELVSALEASNDQHVIFELVIMILLQQVRNLVVSGSITTNIALDILLAEKKVPTQVKTLLQETRECLQSGGIRDTQTIAKVKTLGLCRDIAKFKFD